jgi:hypothetical protein
MFILYKVISKGTAIKDLLLSIDKINYTFSGSSLILTLMVKVNNAKQESILLNTINADLFLNDFIIGSVDNDFNISIPAANSVLIPVSIELLYMPVINSIISIISGKFKSMATFILKGSAKVEDIPFPINLKYSLL